MTDTLNAPADKAAETALCVDGAVILSKKELREIMRKKAEALPKEYTKAASTAITKKLIESDAFKRASTVFCFVGAENEIDTREFLKAVLAANKTLCAPYCEKFGVMRAKKIADLSELVKGKYGIYAPRESAETVPPEDIDFAVIPCLAATPLGARLGYGGGFYDRYIPKMTNAECICICRKKLLLDDIPKEAHDAPVSVITE